MRLALAAFSGALLFSGAALAEPWAVGGKLPPLALADQHGAPIEIDASVRALIFSREMTGGGIVKEALANDGAAFLTANRAVYVSDVSRMPGLILRTFALPSLRRRDYRIALDETGEATRDVPGVDGKPTLIALAAGTIVSIASPGSAEELRAAVAAAAAPALSQPAQSGEAPR